MEVETGLGFSQKVKYVEYMGRTVSQLLCRKDPWGAHCGREHCMPCKTEPGKCMRQGCIYLMTCMMCEKEGRHSYYIGESARTPYDRGHEHLSAIRRLQKESPLVEHFTEDHSGQTPDFEMKIIGTPTSNILRQTGEYQHMLKYSELGNLLNRRGEWGQNLPPKLVMEEEEKGGKRSKDQPQAGRPTCQPPPGSHLEERSPPHPPPASKRSRESRSVGPEECRS